MHQADRFYGRPGHKKRASMFFDKHFDVLRAAAEANRMRTAWTGYSPITPPDPATADRIVKSYDGASLQLCAATSNVITASEVSPYSGQALNVTYAAPSKSEAPAAAHATASVLSRASSSVRVGVGMEALHRIHQRGAEFAAVTAHTTRPELGDGVHRERDQCAGSRARGPGGDLVGADACPGKGSVAADIWQDRGDAEQALPNPAAGHRARHRLCFLSGMECLPRHSGQPGRRALDRGHINPHM